MKSNTNKHLVISLIILMLSMDLSAQSQDGWVKRKWHDMLARFNGYYNSTVLVEGAFQTLEEGHVDNFNEILRVFPYGSEEDASTVTGDMDKVYEKASKVIRKHPNSKWEDDCFMLIGKSHFLKYDPFSAIETFQYINKKYKDNEIRYDAQVWILKSYLRQEKYNDAEAIMGLFLQDEEFPERLDKELNAIAADIYIQQGKYAPAIEKLEIALDLTRDRGQKYRWHFILGQLYLKQDKWEEARDHFVRTIKLNPPYDLAFQSNLGLVKTISMGDGSLKTPKKYLNRMLDDDKNIDYFDQIYFELANIAVKEGNLKEAIDYYQKSARTSTSNTDQKASAYLELANIFFKQRNYTVSQAYFDSTVSFISEEHERYEEIKSRHSILTDLIDNLIEYNTQDSLLKLSVMDRKDLDKMIEDIIRKKKLEAERKATEKEMNSFANNPGQPRGMPQNPNIGTGFYFENKAAMSRGQAEFTRKWGSRKRTDFWRIAEKSKNLAQKQEENPDKVDELDEISYDKNDDEELQQIMNEIPQDKREYYKDIPFSELGKKIANQRIQDALFNIGMLYEEKLKEYETALNYYNKLIARYPETSLGAEVYFHMHKCHSQLGNEAKAEEYASILNDKFKESQYNQVVNNRDVEREPGEEEEVLDLYHQMYAAFQAEEYDKAIAIRNEANQKYFGNSIQAKYDYLYAKIIGIQGDKDQFIELLGQLVQNYPGTQIANEAEFTINHIAREDNVDEIEEEVELNTGDYTYKKNEEHYYILVFKGGKTEDIKKAFANYNKDQHRLDNLKVHDYVLGDKQVIAIQSFVDKDASESYYIEFIKKGKFMKDLGMDSYDTYFISKSNFKMLLGEQNDEEYANFFILNYIQ